MTHQRWYHFPPFFYFLLFHLEREKKERERETFREDGYDGKILEMYNVFIQRDLYNLFVRMNLKKKEERKEERNKLRLPLWNMKEEDS